MKIKSLRPAALFAVLALLLAVGSVPIASAHCPLCVVGAASGIAAARYYGVDDIITGLWLGAFVVSMALWSGKLVEKMLKRDYIPFQTAAVMGAVIIATIVPFYLAGFFKGMPTMSDTIFGINRLAFGTLIGAISIGAAPYLSGVLKKRKVSLPYQTIIITFGALLVLSLLFWYITAYFVIV